MRIARIASLSAVLLALAAPARAAGGCKDDIARFCKHVRPGGGRILACLKEHEGDLTESCKAEGRRLEHAKEIAEECKGDAEKLCPGVKAGGGRIARCLRQHQDQVSEQCRQSVQGGKKPAGN